MNGLHLTADLRDCAPTGNAVMTEPGPLRDACLAAVQAAGLTAVGELFHRFASADGEPAGATGVVLLAESHVAVHTWPELNAVTVDVYVCNFSADNTTRAHTLMDHLLTRFHPGRTERHALQRGAL